MNTNAEMKFRWGRIVLLMLLIVAIVWYFSPSKITGMAVVNEPAATVNGQTITMAELNAAYGKLPNSYTVLVPKTQILEQLIMEKLILSEAKKEGIIVSDSDIETVISDASGDLGMTSEAFILQISETNNLTKNEIYSFYKKQLTTNDLLNKTLFSTEDFDTMSIDDSELKKFYDSNSESFLIPEQVEVSHILVTMMGREMNEVDAILQKVENRLSAGEAFEDVARNLSEGPSAPNGGYIGNFSRGQYVKEFEEIAFTLSPGAMSGPVKSTFGYHIIKLHNKIPEHITTFVEAKKDISDYLIKEKQSALIDTYLRDLRAGADIVILYKSPVINS